MQNTKNAILQTKDLEAAWSIWRMPLSHFESEYLIFFFFSPQGKIQLIDIGNSALDRKGIRDTFEFVWLLLGSDCRCLAKEKCFNLCNIFGIYHLPQMLIRLNRTIFCTNCCSDFSDGRCPIYNDIAYVYYLDIWSIESLLNVKMWFEVILFSYLFTL